MEEIRSTKRLESEILEDARKKAARILQNAEAALEKSRKNWAEKQEQALTAMEQQYKTRIEKRRYEIMARLPLDKRRIRAERAEKLLNEAMQNYLQSLSRPKQIKLLQKELERIKAWIQGKPELIEYTGLTKAEAESLASVVYKDLPADILVQSASDEKSPGALFITTESLSARVSLSELARNLLSDKRSELAEALLGEESLHD